TSPAPAQGDLGVPAQEKATQAAPAPDRATEAAPTAPGTVNPDAPTTAAIPADPLGEALAARLADGKAALHPRLGRKDREAMAAFYAIGGYQMLWLKDGAWTAPAQALIRQIKNAAEEGLEAADYPIPVPPGREAAPAAVADAELKLSAAAVAYARDARGARIEPSRLSNLITPKLELPAPDAVLTSLAAAADAGAALSAYNPPHAGYRALRDKLAQLRANRPSPGAVRVPQGPALKVGMRDARVRLIRARFGLGGDDTAYDERVAAAVADFQREKGLPADGVLDRKTVSALSGPAPSVTEEDVLSNMERWRWLPADLGRRHIWVNVPEYRLRLMTNGRPVYEARVIVGKPDTPTPLFSDEMDHAIVNPSWYMPPSIFKNEFNSDPAYAAARGFEVKRGRDGGITVRQPPGERNALGLVKFMFPNRHAVYLHDTPNRRLFAADKRAFSHGCVRLDQPFRFGEMVLGPQWTEARLKSLIGNGERTIKLPEKIPVHITYFTLQIDEKGGVHRAADLYGVNNKVRVALGLSRDPMVVVESPRPAPRPQAAARKRTKPVQTVVQAPAPLQPQQFWWFTR
ncbi:MAG TPA: L,D-transpeptidase family protein, partial [Beijerinckiaceae bacterium]|nr:L,D-transpeptidase family protein [Beijerinckiaceae bacterium]